MKGAQVSNMDNSQVAAPNSSAQNQNNSKSDPKSEPSEMETQTGNGVQISNPAKTNPGWYGSSIAATDFFSSLYIYFMPKNEWNAANDSVRWDLTGSFAFSEMEFASLEHVDHSFCISHKWQYLKGKVFNEICWNW